jgi:hypothetical protein
MQRKKIKFGTLRDLEYKKSRAAEKKAKLSCITLRRKSYSQTFDLNQPAKHQHQHMSSSLSPSTRLRRGAPFRKVLNAIFSEAHTSKLLND